MTGGSTVSRFRLFARSTPAAPAPPHDAARSAAPWWAGGPAPAPVPPPGWGTPPPAGAGAPLPGVAPAGRVTDDAPTDPYGFPPVPAAPVAAPAPDHAEAAALAGAFAVDYLSWDEDDPSRRGRVLADYLAVPADDTARLGWSGRGRQRAEFALPGLVRPDGDGRVLVDVRVRVTPYREVGDRAGRGGEPDAQVPGVPAAAPAPTARGWRSLASQWIRISVPVTAEGGRLVVDAWEECLAADEPPRPVAPVPPGEDHALDGDDPLVEPVAIRPGGAW